MIIVKAIVEWNIKQLESILKNPEIWGSGTKEYWEKELEKQKEILEKPRNV